MSSILHIGKKRIVTITATDGSIVPLGSVVAISGNPSMATAVVDPATNLVTVTGIAPGTVAVVYNALGYLQIADSFSVQPLPSLIATDGPEV